MYQQNTKAMKQIRKDSFMYGGDKLKHGDVMITFGKYKDLLTFSELYEQESGYCRWVLKNFEQNKSQSDQEKNPQGDDLLNYILQRNKLEIK